MATCIEYHEERTHECDDWEDQGYDSCSSWNPWIAWLCIGWTWVSHWVCVGWTWVTTSVCVLWDTAVTVVDAVIVTLESIGLGWLLNLLAAIVEIIFVIPIIGPFIQWLWNIVLTAVSAILSVIDIFAYFVGIRPQKKLRVCTVIFADTKGNPVAATADVVNVLNTAIDIYFREMNVAIIRSAPFQYSTGFLQPPRANASWVATQQVSNDQLTACCNECMAGEELLIKGSFRKLLSMLNCYWGNWRRLLGLGSPVAIFVLRNMNTNTVTLTTGGTTTTQTIGCGLGPLTDFVVIAATAPAVGITNALQSNPETLAHELGHISNLWHLTDAQYVINLMFENEKGLVDAIGNPLVRLGTNLFGWQCQIVRMSRHISYL